MSVVIRAYRSTDCHALCVLFTETVHSVNLRDYTLEQVNAWADGQIDEEAWNASFLAHRTWVAVDESGKMVGFLDLDDSGYLDRLYVHKDHQRQGIACMLCDEAEQWAAEHGIKEVHTYASLTAIPFFEKHGYCLRYKQEVFRKGIGLVNALMVKALRK